MKASEFFNDFKQNLTRQYEECMGYRLLCENMSYNPYKDLLSYDDIKNVPFIATTLFKKSQMLFMDLLRVTAIELEKWTISSSTTGDPSIVGRREADIAQLREFVRIQDDIFHPSGEYNCVFFPEPDVMSKHGSQQILGKPTESYIGNICNAFDYSKNTTFLLKPGNDDFIIDKEAFVNFINFHSNKNNDLSVRGSTLLIYNTIKELKEKMSPVNLGSKAKVHTGGGGWDGKKGNVIADKQIERWEFVEEVSNFLGIPEENFIDTYSFTENSLPITGHFSKEYRDYLFHVPDWGRVILRDVKTLEPIEYDGGIGFIQVLNAYGTSAYAGASILVDDMAEIISAEECPECGHKGMTLRIIGRVKGSEAKGCGATLNVRREA